MTRSSAEKIIAMLLAKKEKLLTLCQNSLLPEYLKRRLGEFDRRTNGGIGWVNGKFMKIVHSKSEPAFGIMAVSKEVLRYGKNKI